MKTIMVLVTCQECGKGFTEKKTWHGQSEICSECSKKRTEKDNCKRHGGIRGLNCYPCKLEGKLNA